METKINIFFVDENPLVAAQALVDRHVVKMILESAQLLSTAHRLLDGEEIVGKSKSGHNVKRWKLYDQRENVIYQATHINHPSAVWTRKSVENYNWLVDHFFGLMMEYNNRYNKQHKCYGEISYLLASPPKNLKNWDFTKIPSCMPDEFKISDNPVENYRKYYREGKSHLHKWKNNQPPEWITV